MATESADLFQNFFRALREDDFSSLVSKYKGLKVDDEHGTPADIYLSEYVFPVLFAGIEELSQEVERLQNDETINPEIRSRFNPCIFLSQYLMRNNPKFATEEKKNRLNGIISKFTYFDQIIIIFY